MNHASLPLADMQVFAAVVDHRGFAAAARQLHLTTSAVSRSVTRLEQQLGVKLLHRTTRALSLTEVGTSVYASCTQMLNHAEQALAQASALRQQPQGLLSISAPYVFGDVWLAPLLPRFCTLWPEVQVQLSMSDAMVDLAAQGIDLAIRIATSEALPQTLVAKALRPVRYVLAANPAYLSQHAAIVTPDDLSAHHCMTLGYGAFQALVELKHRHKDQAPIRVRLNTPITIATSFGLLNALTQNQSPGIALVADFVAEPAIADGRLASVLPDWELAGSYAPRTAYAVYAPGPHVPPKLRAMLDFLTSECERK